MNRPRRSRVAGSTVAPTRAAPSTSSLCSRDVTCLRQANHRARPLAPAVSLACPALSLRRDQKTPESSLTLADRGHVGIRLKSQVDNPAIARAHGVERDHGPRLLGLARQTVRQLPQRLLATLPVALDVER